MRRNRFRFSIKQHLSVFLIFCLLLSQTVQVSFFDRTEAAVEDYRDIVSIIVDRETYSELSWEIKRYSEDIQWYLGDTRVSLFVVPDGTPPEAIAAQNEKLYYEGDGEDGITSLVGTVLIGNVPIPMVERDGDSFPSLFPYVDFDEKRFVYNPRSGIYQYAPNARENTDVEIWHWVINPSVWRTWKGDTDIDSIRAFLDKTHDFYTKSGKFAPSWLPPRVFYYDGYNESASINARKLYQYSLYIANAENFAYKRFTKHLLADINAAIVRYDSTSGDDELDDSIASLGYGTGSDTLDTDTISVLPDIQTARPIGAFVQKFYQIVNSKVLSDSQLFVHNAGRYTSGSTVRVDHAILQATLMDEVALSMIKEWNAAMEKAIDDQITAGNYARKMILFDKMVQTVSGVTIDGTVYPTKDAYSKIYNGYIFGQQVSSITSPEQCTIARWYSGTDALYGQSVRVEANIGYDVNQTQPNAEILKKDTEELVNLHRSSAYSCFDPNTGSPKITSYWWWNTLMRVATPGADTTNIMNNDILSDLRWYSLPIFSLGWMRETSRLRNPSLLDCQDSAYNYALLQPYTYTYQYEYNLYNWSTNDCTAWWPDEWNLPSGYNCLKTLAKQPRYSCLTKHDVLTTIPTLAESVQDYNADTCFAGKLYVDGRNVKTGTNTCIKQEWTGDSVYDVDTTKYEDRYYHSIPSLWKHISPTAEEVTAAQTNGATPSLPVDIVRSFEFLTPKWNIARLQYPNFFQAPAWDRATLRAWLKELSQSQWNKIIAQENATTLTPEQIEAHSYIPATSLPVNPIDWNTLISDTVLDKIIQARNWIHPDITQKAKNIVETSLSYSHQYSDDITKNPPFLPQTGSGYDIAYLWLTSLSPLADDGDATSIENEYNTTLASIRALNMWEDGIAGPDSAYNATAQCGPPDGVMIFQWPSAIMCWVGSLLPPKISGWSCGGSTIGMDTYGPRVQTGPSADILADTVRLQAYYAPMQLVSSFPKTVMQRRESIAVSFDYTSPDDEHVSLPTGSRISLRIQSLTASGLSIPSDRWDDYLEIAPDVSPYGDAWARFGILSKNDLLEAKLQWVLETPLPDGSIYRSVSADITLRVSDEYIDVSPMMGDTRTSTIDTTMTSPVTLDFSLMNASWDTLPHAFPYTLDIYDTFEDTLIQSWITINTPEYTLSSNYTKKIGTYRFALRDRFGRNGDTTLSVRSWPLARATLVPVSSAIVKWSQSLGILRLTDKLDNILTPELYSIDITARGGYIVDPEWKKLEKLHLDSIDSELILTYGSDTAGTLDITVTIDGSVTTNTSLQILESARVIIERSQAPVVAGDPIQVRLKVVNPDNTLVTGFSSVALVSLPEGAGYFASGESIEITGGQSQMVTFYPGRVSGDHILSLDIPWLTDVADSVFRVLPWQSMYIVPSLDDTSFSFSLRDRYGNITPESTPATLRRNTDTPISVNFTDGILKQPRDSGYYVIDAPALDTHSLTYSDGSGSYTLTGISFATLYVPPASSEFSFLWDYNARYTILAGWSFLAQWEDILYDVDPGESSSLAVSTLLDSPYRRESFFSIFPGGGYALGESSDAVLTSAISLERNTLILTVRDDVTHSQIWRVGYPIRDPELSQCIEDTTTSRTCELLSDEARVRFITLPGSGYTTTLTGDRVSLGTPELSLVSYDRNAGWTMAPGVTLSPDESASLGYLVLSVELQGTVIGRILVSTDTSSSVLLSDDLTTPRAGSSVILSQTDTTFPISENYTRVFDPSIHGYTIFAPSATDLLDENRIGPNHIDSIWSLSETPWVGWHDQNRLLLAYSAGESVGEASRYFHTYTYVNLWDPVAHVDTWAPGTQREGIDRTIGKQIASSAHGPIESYVREDMNRDGYEDIILVYSDGFLELLVNVRGNFRSKKMIAHIPDRGNRGISLWDFRWDGYGDIITVDNSGSLILIDNDLRRLTRTPLRLSETSSLPLPSGITQFQIYDMDADTRDDIAYLTESGELGILYGTETMGLFSQKILDSTLGVSLSLDPEVMGGALSASVVPEIDRVWAPSTGTGLDDTILLSEVYYQRTVYDPTAPNALPSDGLLVTDPTLMTSTLSTFLGEGDEELVPESTRTLTYVRSEYAPAFGVEVSKLYRNTSGRTLRAGDRVEVDIALKNTGTSPITDGEYLDTIPVLFDPENTDTYTLTLSGMSEERRFERIREDYDAVFSLVTIPVGATLHITYEVEVLPASYGEMIVSKLEWWEIGDDTYGDIGFQTSTTCGADLILWRSEGARDYQRGTRSYTHATIPEDIQSRITDSDGDGVPDSIQNMDIEERKSAYESMWDNTNFSSNTSNLITSNISWGNVLDIGFSDESISEVSTIVDNLTSGFRCGFGWWSCMSFPVNWAPLAPGSVPSLFGMPLGNLTPSTGLPVFSALTGIPIYGPWWCFPMPATWPPSPIGFESTCGSNTPNAWGVLWTTSAANALRIYVTPTLTLGMGTAVCFGGPASTAGNTPPPGTSPIVSWGNCIIMAQPMPVCKGDGSSDDGDILGVSGLGWSTDAWNGESCSLQVDTRTDAEDRAFTTSIIDYLKDKDTTRLNAIYTSISKRGPRKVEWWLVMNIWGGGEGASTISMDFDSSKPFDLGSIINVKNIRIPAFPDFIMDWWDRQTAEVSNKLFTLPNIVIVPPTDLGPNATADGSSKSYKDVFSDMKEKANAESLQKGMSQAFGATNVTDQFNKKTTGKTESSSSYNAWLDKTVQANSSTINSVQGSANALKAAYKYIWQIPFLDIRQSSVSVNVPWILPQELDRYSRALEQWSSEVKWLQEKWCDAELDAECLDEQTSLNMAAFQSSIDRNIQVIQGYRDFPKKIQDYVTWRQKYTVWALCNIETIQQFTGKWVKENGVRFQKWAEFYVLMKAIVDGSWQPILDIFSKADAQCGTCVNQRYNLDYFIYKLIGSLIPTLPIIVFPKWPDIVLDLSDFRFAIAVDVPDFKFNVTPIRLPDLPSLSLPDAPTGSLTLPALPTLPAIPDLPPLPQLPSLPRISLPPLPPPPKLPKVFGAISIMTNILKIFEKIKCIAQETILVPEWKVGEVIAQRTARQGTLPIDFLNFQLPQMSMPWLKEIRVQSHVNLELRSEFITEFARTAVKPINEFGTDLNIALPNKIGEDLRINGPENIERNLEWFLEETNSGTLISDMIAELEHDATVLLDTDEFSAYFRSELIANGRDVSSLDKSLAKARIESEETTAEILENHETQVRLLKQYIQAEEAKTKEIEKLIDTLKNPPPLLSGNDIPTATFVSRETDRIASALAKYEDFITDSYVAETDVDETGYEKSLRSYQGRMDRLMAASNGEWALPESGGYAADGYTPKFEGIYILTPSGYQTRLFDYIEPLSGDETVDVIDIDQDGDKDYIYLMDGALYLKENHTYAPSRQNDTTLIIRDIDEDAVPEAPNYFTETVASPGEIELSFSPADMRDTAFRLEFFDRYTEWDLTRIGAHDEESVPRTTIDLSVSDASRDTMQGGISVHPLSRALSSVSVAEGMSIHGVAVVPVLPDTSFTVSLGRPIYTGKSSSRLIYSTSSGSQYDITLKPYSRYTFDDVLSGSLTSGKIFFYDTLASSQTPYTDDMINMPIIEGMTLSNSQGSFSIVDTESWEEITRESGGEYRIIDLPFQSESYAISFPYQNWFYSARLTSLSRDVSAGVTLLAPQASLDQSAPIVDLADTLDIPVYQTSVYPLSDIITEMSAYTVSIDPDVAQDENTDGIYDNDFVTTATGVTLTDTSLIFGPYDTLESHLMSLRVEDEYRNITLMPLQIRVYAPIPQIETVSSSGYLMGTVAGELRDEPVHFLRIRQGTPIDIIREVPTYSQDEGIFATGTLFTGSGARFSYSGGTVNISESTGLPIGTSSLQIRVLPATSTDPMRILSIDSDDVVRFEQFLTLPSDIGIRIATGAIASPTPIVSVLERTGYRATLATLTNKSIPWGVYITDGSYTPYAALARDGNIYTLRSGVTLRATTYDGYLMIEIIDGEKNIADIVYQTDFFYTLK